MELVVASPYLQGVSYNSQSVPCHTERPEGIWMPLGPPPRKLALPLSSAGPFESTSMEMEVLCHVSTFDDSRTYRIFVVLFLTFLL